MTDLHNEDSLVDFARREIQTRIENGVYLPGSKLSALDISNSLGISRTPVVSALNQLVAQGFAEKTSPRSTVVTQLHLSQVKEILQVREMIEMYASELIVKNLPFQTDKVLQLETISKRLSERESDDYAEARDLETQFHTGFISLGCNSRITKFYETNWSVGIVFLLFARSHMTLYRERESCAQHMEMLEFAKQGDVGGLRHIISEHLRIVNDTMDWLIDNGGNAIFKLM